MDAKLAQHDYFFFNGLHLAGNMINPLSSLVSPMTMAQLSGLNTLRIVLARIDYASWGVIPPLTRTMRQPLRY